MLVCNISLFIKLVLERFKLKANEVLLFKNPTDRLHVLSSAYFVQNNSSSSCLAELLHKACDNYHAIHLPNNFARAAITTKRDTHDEMASTQQLTRCYRIRVIPKPKTRDPYLLCEHLSSGVEPAICSGHPHVNYRQRVTFTGVEKENFTITC